MNSEYISTNDAERARLNTMLDALSPEDLALELPNGLTIAASLVHLAFWDDYARAALQGYQADGFFDSHTNFEAVNSAVQVLAARVADSAAVEMVREAAEATDLEAASVPAELAETIIANGKLRTLERAQHRRVHMDQIENALSTHSRNEG